MIILLFYLHWVSHWKNKWISHSVLYKFIFTCCIIICWPPNQEILFSTVKGEHILNSYLQRMVRRKNTPSIVFKDNITRIIFYNIKSTFYLNGLEILDTLQVMSFHVDKMYFSLENSPGTCTGSVHSFCLFSTHKTEIENKEHIQKHFMSSIPFQKNKENRSNKLQDERTYTLNEIQAEISKHEIRCSSTFSI